MKTLDQIIDNFTLSYPLDTICDPEKALFLDIETTGFTARSSSLYMIGCAYLKDSTWHTIQWFAQDPSQQADVLKAFLSFAQKNSFLIHFNGNQFDLPYLKQKCEECNIEQSLDAFDGLDLYRRIFPYRKLFPIPDCKQKSLEKFLQVGREDLYTGGELIEIYEEYTKAPTENAENLLLLHNREDLIGMLSILPILSYRDLFNKSLKAIKVQANHYRDLNDARRTELLITLALPVKLPVPLTINAHECIAKLEGGECILRVPVFEETLKYFYANYKDYYYLPEEDLALHKSVATFVDKDHRIQATAQNCYTRKNSTYLPQWDTEFKPFFKRNYQDHELFFELTDEMKKDRTAFACYATHVLKMIAESQK